MNRSFHEFEDSAVYAVCRADCAHDDGETAAIAAAINT